MTTPDPHHPERTGWDLRPQAGVDPTEFGDGEVPGHLAHLFVEAHRRLEPPSVPGDRWVPPDEDLVAAILGAEAPVILAGPDVIALGAVPGMHALATALSAGVLNTWGAKGLFDWRSRHHLATAGLQAEDFALAGFGDADLIIATGVDEREATADWRLAPVVEVHPWGLGALAERVGRARREIPMPPLRSALAAATQAGWAIDTGPLPPSRVTRTYGEALAGTGLVAADPGTAGFWVARTLPTSGLGGAQVPADGAMTGFAIAAAVVAGRLTPGRPTLAVVDGVGDETAELLEVAARLGVPVAVEAWTPDGDVLDAEAHAERLAGLLAEGGVATLTTNPDQLSTFVEAAGPITAWTH